jgi:hypothetical protein
MHPAMARILRGMLEMTLALFHEEATIEAGRSRAGQGHASGLTRLAQRAQDQQVLPVAA